MCKLSNALVNSKQKYKDWKHQTYEKSLMCVNCFVAGKPFKFNAMYSLYGLLYVYGVILVHFYVHFNIVSEYTSQCSSKINQGLSFEESKLRS